MTEKYKKVLLDYFTGYLKKEVANNEEIIKEINELPVSSWAEFLLTENEYLGLRIEGIIAPNENTSNLTIVYGGYFVDTSTEGTGVIFLLDREFKPIKKFETFNNGTKLRYIQQMEVSDDGTFFAVDDKLYSYDNAERVVSSEKRFIMLNNFTTRYEQINDYILNLQKSYIFPENCKNFYCKYMTRNPSSSHYFMAGSRANCIGKTWNYDAIGCIDLKINVSESNEWNFQGSEVSETSEGEIYGSAYAEFDQEDRSFFEIVSTPNYANKAEIHLYKQDFNQNSWNKSVIKSYDHSYHIDSVHFNNQCIFKNRNELLFVLSNEHWGNADILRDKYIGLYYCNINKKIFKVIYEEELGQASFSNKRGIYLAENNNDIYILYCVDDNEDNIADFYYFRYDDIWNPKLIVENKPFYHNRELLFVKSNFNLLQVFEMKTNLRITNWFQLLIKEDYNSVNYNGSSYECQKTLIPKKIELFDSDSFIFARNLYNKSINNNTTISTVEVPNTYLNNTLICLNSLLSDTNLELIKKDIKLEKNIYETLYLNFINSLIISNQNDPDNKILNQEGSNYLNYAINDENAYENAKLYKNAIINYADQTSKEIEYKIEKISETICNLNFNLYIDKEASSIDFISNNKSIIYHTIDVSNLEPNKYYKINQKLEVV